MITAVKYNIVLHNYIVANVFHSKVNSICRYLSIGIQFNCIGFHMLFEAKQYKLQNQMINSLGQSVVLQKELIIG